MLKSLPPEVIGYVVNDASPSIPFTKVLVSRNPVPWWNAEFKSANRGREQTFNYLKRHLNLENLIDFKKLRAKERQIKLAIWPRGKSLCCR